LGKLDCSQSGQRDKPLTSGMRAVTDGQAGRKSGETRVLVGRKTLTIGTLSQQLGKTSQDASDLSALRSVDENQTIEHGLGAS
jgi:hypothetical protein